MDNSLLKAGGLLEYPNKKPTPDYIHYIIATIAVAVFLFICHKLNLI